MYYSEMDRKLKKRAIFSFLIVFMQIGHVYAFPLVKQITFGEVFLILSIPMFLGVRPTLNTGRIPQSMKLFVIYSGFITFLVFIEIHGNLSDIVLRLLRDGLYIFTVFIMCGTYLEYNQLKKYIILFGKMLSIFVIIQVLVYLLFHVQISGFIPGLLGRGGRNTVELSATYLRQATRNGFLRPNGFLLEPAHVSQTLAISLITVLFSNNIIKHQMLWAIIFTTAAVSTFSTSGFIFVVCIWIIWIFYYWRKRFANVLLGLLLFAIAFFLFQRFSSLGIQSVLNRVHSILNGEVDSNSTFLRLFNGLNMYQSLDIIHKFFGIGFGNFKVALSSGVIGNNVSGWSTYALSDYLNSFYNLIICSGVVGVFLYAFSFVNIFLRTKTPIKRAAIILFGLMMFSSGIYSSPTYIWILCLIFFGNEHSEATDTKV